MGSLARKLLRKQLKKDFKYHPALKNVKHDETETLFSKVFHEIVKYNKKKVEEK